jgi:hypothetical protein
VDGVKAVAVLMFALAALTAAPLLVAIVNMSVWGAFGVSLMPAGFYSHELRLLEIALSPFLAFAFVWLGASMWDA